VLFPIPNRAQASTPLSDLWLYHITSASWSEVGVGTGTGKAAPLAPSARYGHAAMLVLGGSDSPLNRGGLLIHGGATHQGSERHSPEFLQDAWLLTLDSSCWRELPARLGRPVPCHGHSLAPLPLSTHLSTGNEVLASGAPKGEKSNVWVGLNGSAVYKGVLTRGVEGFVCI